MTQAPDAPAKPSVPAAPSSGKELRKCVRRRVLKEGKLVFGKGHSVLDCAIDNMSEGGAHVRLSSSYGVPGDFYLIEASRGIIHRAEVAWRTTTGIGLRLLGPLDDCATRETLLRKFRRR